MSDCIKELYKRDWLNEEKGSAYIVLDASHDRYKDGHTYTSATLEIKDCTKSVYLEFDYGTEDQRQARLVKIDKLIDAMHEIKNFIIECTASTADKTPEE